MKNTSKGDSKSTLKINPDLLLLLNQLTSSFINKTLSNIYLPRRKADCQGEMTDSRTYFNLNAMIFVMIFWIDPIKEMDLNSLRDCGLVFLSINATKNTAIALGSFALKKNS